MPTPAEADAISRLGAFALFVLITMFAGVALWRRWAVLGWFFEQERAGRLTAETQATRNVEALEKLSSAFAGLLKEVVGLRREVRLLRDELRALSRKPDA